MNRTLRRLMRFVPKSITQEMMRRSLQIPLPGESPYVFKIAETRQELEDAYRLLHSAYAGSRLMKPHPSGLRCTLYSALPSTTVLVAKEGDRVIATVSLIRDSEVGFPSDKEFQAENDAYRGKGYRMIEVSALAVDPDYRNLGHFVSIQLMIFLYRYATESMDSDMLCATIHPRAYDFYAGIWGFKKNGRTVQYGYVEGALAIHISLDLRTFRKEWLPKAYSHRGPRQNLLEFVERKEAAFRFPVRSSPVVVDPVMTPELLDYFFVQKTSLFAGLSDKERDLVRTAYAASFDLDQMSTLQRRPQRERPYRFPTRLEGKVRSESLGETPVTIYDLSANGLFLETDCSLRIGETYELCLALGESGEIKTLGRVCWTNSPDPEDPGLRPSLRHPPGYGISFGVTDVRIVRHLKAAHHSFATPVASSAEATFSRRFG